jgi:GTP cyclohydrolase I
MNDVQNRSDARGIAIDKVGVADLRYPIVVLDQNNERQQTVARLAMSVNLPHHFKGTHMSRFIEVLNEHRGELTLRTLPTLLNDLKLRLEAESAHIEVVFPYFMERAAPVTGSRALIDFECGFIGSLNGNGDDFILR